MDRARDANLAAQLFGATPERTFVLVRAAWLASVGPDLARRTEVVSVDRGVLQVRVPDATWRRSLWRMRGDILRRLRQVAGRLAPRSVSFIEGPLSTPPADSATPPRGTPPARAAEPPASLVGAAATIPDGELRAEFLAVAARYLDRFSQEPAGEPEGARRSGDDEPAA